MKKVLMGLCVVLACAAASAQGTASAPAEKASDSAKAAWPVWLAFNSTKDIDVVGLRLTLPYGKCEGVTGFDLGFYGRARYFEGLQLNLLRNEAEDVMSGFQIGLYNTVGRADMTGLQIGLFNEARTVNGIQVGLVNLADACCGFQIGLINRAESMYGFQAGAVNVIRSSDMPYLPLLNVGFEVFPNY